MAKTATSSPSDSGGAGGGVALESDLPMVF
jgi:hypothetical protein